MVPPGHLRSITSYDVKIKFRVPGSKIVRRYSKLWERVLRLESNMLCRGEPGELGRGRNETPPFLVPNCIHMNFVHLDYINFMNDNAVIFVFFPARLVWQIKIENLVFF